MTIGIVGNDFLGISLGYFLTQQGLTVEIFEPTPLLDTPTLPVLLEDGTTVHPCFYPVLASDQQLHRLLAQLDLSHQLQVQPKNLGFLINGQIYALNSLLELTRFAPLGWIDRLRLGWTLLYSQRVPTWYKLESIAAQEWLHQRSGPQLFKKFWQPILKNKFAEEDQNIPATYIWAWLKQISSAHSRTPTEHLTGGYDAIIKAMSQRIEAAGGIIHHESPVQTVIIQQNQVQKLRLPQGTQPIDTVAITTQLPHFRRLLAGNRPDYDQFLKKMDFLGSVCLLLVLNRPLTGYSTINIADSTIPFERVETTTFTGSHANTPYYLVQLPKYITANATWHKKSDTEIKELWLQHLEKIFPTFERNWITHSIIHRKQYAAPLHRVNSNHLIPNIRTPIDNLYLVTTDQIYPMPPNAEEIIQHAQRATQMIVEDFSNKPE